MCAFWSDICYGVDIASWDVKEEFNMSLDMRYLTNGKKEIYTVRDSLHMTFNVYEKREDVPENIRHYVPEKVQYAGPDLARIFGVLDILYPNFPKCGWEGYTDRLCIGDGCRFDEECGGYMNCLYFDKSWKNTALEG